MTHRSASVPRRDGESRAWEARPPPGEDGANVAGLTATGNKATSGRLRAAPADFEGEEVPEPYEIARRARCFISGASVDGTPRADTFLGAPSFTLTPGLGESVFGQIKAGRGADRFLRRGRAPAPSEWRVPAATHNLLKLHRAQFAAS